MRSGRCRRRWPRDTGRAREGDDLVGCGRQQEAVAHRRRREVVRLTTDRQLLHGAAVESIDAVERAPDRPHQAARHDGGSGFSVGCAPGDAERTDLHGFDPAATGDVHHGPEDGVAAVGVGSTARRRRRQLATDAPKIRLVQQVAGLRLPDLQRGSVREQHQQAVEPRS